MELYAQSNLDNSIFLRRFNLYFIISLATIMEDIHEEIFLYNQFVPIDLVLFYDRISVRV